ncbi:MAG TPA: sialidase family protein [Vicinamibacteria bacterium]
MKTVLLAFTLVVFVAGFGRVLERPSAAPFGGMRTPPATGGEPSFETRFVSRRHDATAHAASLVELRDGRLRAFWFSGSQEGALDVEILSATFDPATGWRDERSVVGPESTRRALWRHVVKVGNATALRTRDGTLWLFYVTVSVGGWGGSTVTAIRSRDDGLSWGSPRRLIGSAFFNLNTMVRGAPFEHADGTIGLPAYQSLLRGFSELLRVDPTGAVIDKQRLSTPGRGSQPTILPTSPAQAVAFMRHSGQGADPRVTVSQTWDGGRHWTPATRTPLRNPDSAVGGVALPERGLVLLALNDVDIERDVLSLVVSGDGGRSFADVHRLEDQFASRSEPPDDVRYAKTVEALARATDASVGDARPFVRSSRRFMCWEPRCHFEFSYPFLLRTDRGEFHLLYTWNRAYIKHVRFNQAWLDQRLGSSSRASAR